ncbi:MAG: hypothetical protein LBK75_10830 [Oscillospiraceae bacterium]|jgi:hypothetical protein|nr:hypothetical protein [Oscillospiraceae bacterium]
MTRVRDPFAVETADGFPVLHSGPASRPHAARAVSGPAKQQKHVKSEEKPPNKENAGDK